MSQLVLKILVLFRIISIAFVPYQGFPCQFCHDSGELGIIQLNFSLKKLRKIFSTCYYLYNLGLWFPCLLRGSPQALYWSLREHQWSYSLFYSPRKEGNSYLTQNLSLRNPSPLCQLRTRGFHVDTSWHLWICWRTVWAKPSGGYTLLFRNATQGSFLVGLTMPDFDDLWDVFISCHHTQ